jgi:hypothetical protein
MRSFFRKALIALLSLLSLTFVVGSQRAAASYTPAGELVCPACSTSDTHWEPTEGTPPAATGCGTRARWNEPPLPKPPDLPLLFRTACTGDQNSTGTGATAPSSTGPSSGPAWLLSAPVLPPTLGLSQLREIRRGLSIHNLPFQPFEPPRIGAA